MSVYDDNTADSGLKLESRADTSIVRSEENAASEWQKTKRLQYRRDVLWTCEDAVLGRRKCSRTRQGIFVVRVQARGLSTSLTQLHTLSLSLSPPSQPALPGHHALTFLDDRVSIANAIVLKE